MGVAAPRFRVSLAAGLVDSGVASLATFVIGLFAARHLSLEELGIYGLAFSGFIFAASVPALLVFTPVEVELLGQRPERQIGTLPRALRLGIGPAVASSVFAGSIVLLLERSAVDESLPLIVGALVASVLSPLQDHIRRMFHQVSWNWSAAVMSITQLVVAVGALVAMSAAEVTTAWIPFGALALANLVSSALGLVLSARRWERPPEPLVDAGQVSVVGVWLLLSGSLEQGAQFFGLTIVTAVAGKAVVGNFEATRVLSQPMYVIATGVLSVVGPRVMHASKSADRHEAARYTSVYLAVLAVLGTAYLLVAGIEWPGNPLVTHFPNAYVTQGLMPAMIAATLVAYSGIVLRLQLIAAGRQRILASCSLAAAAIYLVATAVATEPIGAFAVPVSTLVSSSFTIGAFLLLLRRWYGRGEQEGDGEPMVVVPASPAVDATASGDLVTDRGSHG